jgi:hypothetical protein
MERHCLIQSSQNCLPRQPSRNSDAIEASLGPDSPSAGCFVKLRGRAAEAHVLRLNEMRRVLIPVLGLILIACTIQRIRHDPSTAAEAANIFLKAMYIQHDYQHALMLSDEALRRSANDENLAQTVKMAEEKCQGSGELKAESYVMSPGKTMELFYTERCQSGNLYHRLVLIGDVSNGYRVSGVWFQEAPYPETGLRRKFQNQSVIH